MEPGTLDAALTALNLHDRHNFGRGDEDVIEMLAAVKELLKPGGVLGIIDHYGDPGQEQHGPASAERGSCATAHRRRRLRRGVFGSLRNPEDDHSIMVFDPAIRGRPTDCYSS